MPLTYEVGLQAVAVCTRCGRRYRLVEPIDATEIDHMIMVERELDGCPACSMPPDDGGETVAAE